ncbi:unannotated protein [freshwater metagenome]|uniref:Unannotated protein n=1 Tax=freshwater metagenome TaxID=449393 RepID=A0A6J7JTF5_9ZZZZ|nr:alcohol dehydrogenase catalytic domain-containing protein [Actinomycetota bacterium]
MKAVVFHAKQDLRIEDVAEPTPLPGQVKLKNAHVGICGTDLHVYYDPDTCGSDFSKPHPITGAQPPQILGHEFSGTVVEVGDGVEDLKVGDRVAAWPIYHCGTCHPCLTGRPAGCTTAGFHGLTSHGGGLATYTTLKATQCFKLPDSVDLRLGALVEPMSVGWRAVRRSGAGKGSRALVIGAGPIGISVFIALREHGVEDIFVSEPSAMRRAAIAGVGATHVIDPMSTDLAKAIADLTGGAGVDFVFDAAGIVAALDQGISLLAPGGSAVIIGVHSTTMIVDPLTLLLREITIGGSCAYDRQDFAEVIEAMSRGVYDPTGWVADVAFNDVESTIVALHSGQGVKALVTIGED